MTTKSYGYAGNILRVDLTTARHWTESTAEYAPRFLGGRGINQWILLNELRPWVTPFEPANILCFGAGALTGTLVPGASRVNIDSKNALTSGIGSGNAGGWFASELKFAGYDHVVIRGKARLPVYLYIEDEKVSLRPAHELWGKTTRETVELIQEDLGHSDVQVACIGPAGENIAKLACIIVSGSRAVGRCGLGAIMGSKNLKAVAVRGTGAIELKNPDAFMSLVNSVSERLLALPSVQIRKNLGTPAVGPLHNSLSGMPYKNFEDEYYPEEKLAKISPEVFHNQYQVDSYACMACSTPCGHSYFIDHGPYAGTHCLKLEGNALFDFGSRLGIDDPASNLKAQEECGELGLDADNTSGAIAWAIDCFQNSLLSKEDTDGLELNWGDHGVVIELIRKIAHREGIGNLLAEGSFKASQMLGKGSEKYSFHIKGQDLIEGIRSCKGWALGIVVSPRGASHTRGAPYTEYRQWSPKESQETFGVQTAGDPTTYSGKATIVTYYDAACALWDSLGLCFITANWPAPEGVNPGELAEFYSLATGGELSEKELMKAGERIHNVEKMFNVYHVGFTRREDYPPKRLMEEPIKSGPLKGEFLRREDWDKMLDEYYMLRGWDPSTSWPTQATLARLDLAECVEMLEQARQLHRGKLLISQKRDNANGAERR